MWCAKPAIIKPQVQTYKISTYPSTSPRISRHFNLFLPRTLASIPSLYLPPIRTNKLTPLIASIRLLFPALWFPTTAIRGNGSPRSSIPDARSRFTRSTILRMPPPRTARPLSADASAMGVSSASSDVGFLASILGEGLECMLICNITGKPPPPPLLLLLLIPILLLISSAKEYERAGKGLWG